MNTLNTSRSSTPTNDTRHETVNPDRAANFQPVRFRRILVPLDGSAFAERALPLAADVARRTGAELQIVHVDSTFGLAHTPDRLVHEDIVFRDRDDLTRHKRDYVKRLAAQLRRESTVRITPIVLNSRNVTAELSEAIKSDVDLVVMAAYGKGPIRQWTRRSTAHKLIRNITAPVLIVGADGSFASPVSERVRRILIALDGSPGAEQALSPALTLGEITAAEFVLLQVIPVSGSSGPLSRSDSGQLHDAPPQTPLTAAQRYLDEIARRMEQQSCTVDTRVVLKQKSIARTIAAKAAAYNADLIAIATRKDPNKRWLGSIAERVVQFASVPVLVAAV
jgi:nucleotide-binding universal stress UspA family protein